MISPRISPTHPRLKNVELAIERGNYTGREICTPIKNNDDLTNGNLCLFIFNSQLQKEEKVYKSAKR
jgi:hypothetical protein